MNKSNGSMMAKRGDMKQGQGNRMNNVNYTLYSFLILISNLNQTKISKIFAIFNDRETLCRLRSKARMRIPSKKKTTRTIPTRFPSDRTIMGMTQRTKTPTTSSEIFNSTTHPYFQKLYYNRIQISKYKVFLKKYKSP